MKHEQSEILKAYADNKELVILLNDGDVKWIRTNPMALLDYHNCEFFACLPQHKESCLHWLNGGDVEDKNEVGVYVTALVRFGGWHHKCVWMNDCYSFRIKPRKEKRWIGVIKEQFTKGGRVYYKNTECSYETIEDLKRDVHAPNGFKDWQFVQIEIEI